MFSRFTRITAAAMSWVMFLTTTAPAQIPMIRGSRSLYRGAAGAAPPVAPSDSLAGIATTMAPRGLDRPINPDEYVIGPGDQFVLVVKASGTQYNLSVLPGGNVLLPNAGMVKAAGLTITGFREELKRVSTAYYRGGEFICELVVPRTFVTYVLGDVRRPGPVEISAPFRLDMIIAAAGGVMPRGSQREIQVRDSDGTQKLYDLVRLQRIGDLTQNPMLHEGQSVFVPARGPAVEVSGEVWSGQLYEIVPGENVMDIVALAGGFTTHADRANLVVERIKPVDNTVSILSVNEETAKSTQVQDRDVIVVPDRRSFPATDFVRVQGGGGRDGRIYLQEGETLASFRPRFIRLRNDFDLAHANIERSRPDGKIDFIPIDLQKMVEGDTTKTIVLKSGDVINIPQMQDIVFVAGEVVNPGQQDFQRGSPAGRYIAMAGGPTEVGGIDKLEIYDDHGNRRDANRDSVVHRGETVLVKRRTGVLLGNLFLGFVSLTSLFLSVYAVIQQND
jgi:protein involved in polysaccharide export with SLBB domain